MARSIQAQFMLTLSNIRWQGMRDEGWEFTQLLQSQNSVSVEMKKGHYGATFTVPRSLDVVDIHNRLLSHCEQFAALSDFTGEDGT